MRVWVALRWVIAIGVLALVALYCIRAIAGSLGDLVVLGDDEPREPLVTPVASSPPPPLGPVTSGSALPVADFASEGGVVRGATEAALSISAAPDEAFYLQFPLIEGDPTCVESVALELTVVEATASELGVVPAGVLGASPADGSALPDPAILVETPAALAFTDGTAGRLRWDVTTLYRQWTSGEPFAPGGTGVADGTPFAIAIRITQGDPDGAVVFASADGAPETSPALLWRGAEGCGGSPAATAPASGLASPASSAPATGSPAPTA